ncbi:MAG: metallophosphoesterase, partial [Candidatus Hydrogenedentes bacterium]|nr:metallophosphoesterase [Candidatus Hydrogenedentota bacterium]
DVHVQPERGAGDGMATCLRHVQELRDAPEFLIFGGDNVMSVDSDAGRDRATLQLDLWRSVLRSECSLPYACCIGNHDVLGNDPVAGKQWAVDAYALPGRCYTLNRGGWQFIFLDSTYPQDDSYIARLDDGQFEWLAAILQQTAADTPVCVVSHIPIVSASAYLCIEERPTRDWQIPGSWVHLDSHRIKDLFKQYPNVRVCLSGHMHMVDTIDYLGVKYACNGAVSGNWWKGAYHEFHPSYALVDLYEDGRCEVRLESYGWTPRNS